MEKHTPIRVAVVEDHPLVLKAIVQELESQDNIKVVGTRTHGSELTQLVWESSPDVVVLDLRMSEGEFEPISAVEAVRQSYPDVQILVLTGFDDGVWVQSLIQAGALGYVLKSDDLSLYLPDGVRTVCAGERFYSPAVTDKLLSRPYEAALTPKEIGILRLVAEGLSNNTIGERINLSEKTVRNYLWSIYSKLCITGKATHSRVAAINKARDLGLIE